MNLPEAAFRLFKATAANESTIASSFYSPVAAAEMEQLLEDHGVSYRTTIHHSTKRGVVYTIKIYNCHKELWDE